MDINEHIEKMLGHLSSSEKANLKDASKSLSLRYARGNYEQEPLTKLERYAYLLTRLPATHAAINKVLEELKTRRPEWTPGTMLDVGAGPATASWAALKLWPSIDSCQLIEKDPQWIALGICLASTHSVLARGSWLEQDMKKELSCDAADLLIASYALQELNSSFYATLAHALWAKTKGCLVLIEPGTPKGFANLRLLRTLLIELGAHVLAPCTHAQACPLPGSDWCHFSTRLPRNEAHRYAKDVSLSYEDEKYAYLIVTRNAVPVPHARLIRAPIKRSGHRIIDTCTHKGLERSIIARSHLNYKAAKKLQWGSALEGSLLN